MLNYTSVISFIIVLIINFFSNNTGWPRKNVTLTINDLKKTRDRMKQFCALLHIRLFSQQDNTNIVNFDEGVLLIWPFC